MRNASPELIAHLSANNRFITSDLFDITLIGGHVVRLTSAGSALTDNGNLYSSWDIKRDRVRSSFGLSVDTMGLDIVPPTGATIQGVPFFQAVRLGAFDSASVLVRKLFMPVAGDVSLGAIHRFSGRIADVDIVNFGVTATVKSEVELLNVPIPANKFQAGCLNTLYDPWCGINKASRAITGNITAPALDSVAITTGTDLTLGVFKFTSGVNNGLVRSVREHSNGRVYFSAPLVALPASGDGYIAHPGCDKTPATCQGKYSNQVNYRGFPFVPTAETLL